jgi:Fur family ferric uptake transcriptional regulator
MSKSDETYRQAYELMADYIERNQLRNTAERFNILRAVCTLQRFSVNELQAALTDIAISRATVYNNLCLMEKAGVVHRLENEFGKRATQFELVFLRTSSVRVICRLCGRVSEVMDSTIQRMLEDKNFTNFIQEHFSLYMHGHCKVCRKKALRGKTK